MGQIGNFFYLKRQNLKIRRTQFWAERGLIRAVDDDTGGYKVIPVHRFLPRIKALNDMLGNSQSKIDAGPDRDLRRTYSQIVEESVELTRTAQEQGMPTDPSARADLARRQKRTVSVSHQGNYEM